MRYPNLMLRIVVLQMDGLEIAGCFHFKHSFRKGGIKFHLVNLNCQADFMVGTMKIHLSRIEDAVFVFEIRKDHYCVFFTKKYPVWKRFTGIEFKNLDLMAFGVQKGDLIARKGCGILVLEQGWKCPCKGPQQTTVEWNRDTFGQAFAFQAAPVKSLFGKIQDIKPLALNQYVNEGFPPGVGNFNFHPPVGADLCVCPALRVCPGFRTNPRGCIRNHQDLN